MSNLSLRSDKNDGRATLFGMKKNFNVTLMFLKTKI